MTPSKPAPPEDLGRALAALPSGHRHRLTYAAIAARTLGSGWGNRLVRWWYGRAARRHSCSLVDDPGQRCIWFVKR